MVSRLQSLRCLLAEKFPEAPKSASRRRALGCPVLDGPQGGLATGLVTEVCGPSSAAQLLLSAVLSAAVREAFSIALVDAADALDPASWSPHELSRLLWLRCQTSRQAIKAADLLIRDGNLPILVLDLVGLKARELQKIPASTWHRFHRLVENTGTVLLILTARPMVEGASRIALGRSCALADRITPRARLLETLEARIFERGRPLLQPAEKSA